MFSTIMTVVDVVKWAVRIAGCGAPPLLGCLWTVVGTQVLESMASALLETCWFRREIMIPAMNGIAFIRDIPRWIAEQLHGGMVSLVPTEARPWLGAVPTRLPELDPQSVACGGDLGRPSADAATTAFLELVQRFGEEYANELLRTLHELIGERGSDRLTAAMVQLMNQAGSEHRAAGGTAESLRRWRAAVPRAVRTPEAAIGLLRAGIADGSATRRIVTVPGPTMALPPPDARRRPPIRIGPMDPAGPRDEGTRRPGGGGIIIEF